MSTHPPVLLVVADQHRPDFLGVNDDVPVRTPILDRLAWDGVGFRNAVSPSTLCWPWRACLATGLEYDRCGVRDHGADFPVGARNVYRNCATRRTTA